MWAAAPGNYGPPNVATRATINHQQQWPAKFTNATHSWMLSVAQGCGGDVPPHQSRTVVPLAFCPCPYVVSHGQLKTDAAEQGLVAIRAAQVPSNSWNIEQAQQTSQTCTYLKPVYQASNVFASSTHEVIPVEQCRMSAALPCWKISGPQRLSESQIQMAKKCIVVTEEVMTFVVKGSGPRSWFVDNTLPKFALGLFENTISNAVIWLPPFRLMFFLSQ